jgi:GDSL-like Lipase/Acylhydrolase family
MTTPEMGSVTAARIGIVKSLALLAIGLLPWPVDWDKVRDVIDSVRSPELNRAEREGQAYGYYDGLIGVRHGSDSSRGDTVPRLTGNPSGWLPFKQANVVQYREGEFLQFELLPSVERTLFGQPFVTNQFGMHDDPVDVAKSDGTFRIAVLGSSIEMGWGVKHQDTYVNRLEEWLNLHSARLGVTPPRRFEVLNFGVAAYSPMQRLEALRDKVMRFNPDLVIYSATTLDIRLMEIHLCDMMRNNVDLKYGFLHQMAELAGVQPDDLRINSDGEMINKGRLKRKLRPFYWGLYDKTMQAIAADCRVAGVPIVMAIIPRVGKSDQPALRSEPVARLKAIAAHQGLTIIDLSDAFDSLDPGEIEIAAWDDHPNAIGHRRLFLALARAMVKDPEIYRLLFKQSPLVPGAG